MNHFLRTLVLMIFTAPVIALAMPDYSVKTQRIYRSSELVFGKMGAEMVQKMTQQMLAESPCELTHFQWHGEYPQAVEDLPARGLFGKITRFIDFQMNSEFYHMSQFEVKVSCPANVTSFDFQGFYRSLDEQAGFDTYEGIRSVEAHVRYTENGLTKTTSLISKVGIEGLAEPKEFNPDYDPFALVWSN